MEDYTVVYGEFFTRGSHSHQIVKYKVICCAPAELKDKVEECIGWSAVHFIFSGECKCLEV